jgi:hypothetical protein
VTGETSRKKNGDQSLIVDLEGPPAICPDESPFLTHVHRDPGQGQRLPRRDQSDRELVKHPYGGAPVGGCLHGKPARQILSFLQKLTQDEPAQESPRSQASVARAWPAPVAARGVPTLAVLIVQIPSGRA